MDKLTLGSLFDGSGGFPLAGLLCGITPVWASEIEPFPIRVTTKRLPFMKHYGNICEIDGGEIEPVDIITFGSPCTNMSVAGKREGLDGEQSVLFYEAIRIIKEMRCKTNGQYPKYCVWENVPGAFSSGSPKGADFLAVLTEIARVKDQTARIPMPKDGKWLYAGELVGNDYSIAYRVLDAQYWGVPQRRRRIFLVADFTAGRAGKILFESEGVSGYTPQSFGSWQDSAGDVTNCFRAPVAFEPGAASRLGNHYWVDSTCTLRADMGDNQLAVALFENHSQDTRYKGPLETAQTVSATYGMGGNNQPFVVEKETAVIPINTQNVTRHPKSGDITGLGIGENGDPAFTLQAARGHAVAVENHPADGRVKVDESGKVQTLTSRCGTGGGNVPLVMNERQYALTVAEDVANTLTSTDYKGTQCVFEQSPKTLKIRSGCEGGGKGALVQDDKSATLSCNNDQTVFVPTVFDAKQITSKDNRSNPQPGNPCHTLASGNADSAVVCFGICSDGSNSMRSDNPTSGIYEAETSRTLDGNGGNPSCNQGGMAVVCIDQGGGKSGCNITEEQAPTLTCTHGGEPAVCIQGSMIGRSEKNGPQGSGINDEISFTLNTTDKHAVAYAMTTGSFPNVGEDTAFSLLARDYKDAQAVTFPAYCLDRAAYNQGANAQFNIAVEEEISPTVIAKGPNAVAQNPEYTVRRLTPTECALLQGFPPDWCANLETSVPTDEEIDWWAEVFETHRKIMGTSEKPKSRNQIVKWLKDPYSDSAEYKMWGNGVCLNNVVFVLAGIAWAEGLPTQQEETES